MTRINQLPGLLHAFFYEWLIQGKNVSRHTVLSYRDTWRLFLRFVSQRLDRPVSALMLPELTATEVIAFLQHCEQKRKSSTGTRNCRLAAIRSFFSFVADREPLAALQCAEVLRIPTKRAPRRVLCYLETDELESILSQPNRRSIEGQRDHVLLALLYNTGARIQEVLSLCPDAMQLRTPAHIRVLGKGRKERICPIWPETAALIAALMQRQPRQSQEPLFVNRYREPLTSSGVRFRLAQYVRAAARDVPSLLNKRITPHTFRHYLPFRTMSP